MTQIIYQALIFTVTAFGLILMLALILSKIKGKKNPQSKNKTLLQKKTNIREIYQQNINRSLGKTEIKKENLIQKKEMPKRDNQKIRLVKETYNYNNGFQILDGNSKYSDNEIFRTAQNFGKTATMQKYYNSSER